MQRIVLLGFMACGKTTIGQALARRLQCPFVDLDSFITEREGRSPAEIIKTDGEDTFRALETLAVRDVLQNGDDLVIALGGGTWTIPANRTLVALHECLSVWLEVPFEICWQRISENSDLVRPLAPDYETARARYDSRRADYMLAERHIAIGEADPVEVVVERILKDL